MKEYEIYNKILEETWRIKVVFPFVPQTIDPERAAILGHSSAHSLATGPLTADPFISPLGLTMTPALSMVVRCELKSTFEVNVEAFSSSVGFALSYYDCLEHLLSQLRLSFLYWCQKHITHRASWESVKSCTVASDWDNEKIFGSSVVCAIHHGCDWETTWDLQFSSTSSSSTYRAAMKND